MQHRVAWTRHRAWRRGRDRRLGAPRALRWAGRFGATLDRDDPRASLPSRYRPRSKRRSRGGRASSRSPTSPGSMALSCWSANWPGMASLSLSTERRAQAPSLSPSRSLAPTIAIVSGQPWLSTPPRPARHGATPRSGLTTAGHVFVLLLLEAPRLRVPDGAVRFEGSWTPAASIAGLLSLACSQRRSEKRALYEERARRLSAAVTLLLGSMART